MIEVYQNLFVGADDDFSKVEQQEGWAFVQAARDPWHRQALGYTEPTPPTTDKECLIARRDQCLILNLVDSDSPKGIRSVLFYEALDFIEQMLHAGDLKVLIHSNRGVSRAPSIALLYLTFRLGKLPSTSFEDAYQEFIKIYPHYDPSKGLCEFLVDRWDSGLFN